MKRMELTIVNHYDICSQNTGGAQAVKGLYEGLSRWFDINIIVFTPQNYYPESLKISKYITVHPITIPDELRFYNDGSSKYWAYNFVKYYHKDPNIIEKVREIAKKSVIVIAEHVYTWRIIKVACEEKIKWYRSLNVEYDYRRDILRNSLEESAVFQAMYDVEQECCEEVKMILTISEEDRRRIIQLYRLDDRSDKVINIGAGYDARNIQPVFPSKRKKMCQKKFTGFFIGARTPMTEKAVDYCFQIARRCPDLQIILAGSSSSACFDKDIPDNVLAKGVISVDEKKYYLENCDFALNLVDAGSGVNIKALEYFAYGIPLISTRHGIRGVAATPDEDCIVAEANVDGFIDAIKKLFHMSLDERDLMAKKAFNLLMNNYTWDNVSFKCMSLIKKCLNIKIDEFNVPLNSVCYYPLNPKKMYIPRKDFYIRCAGFIGVSCAMLLREKGLSPLAFVDEKKKDGILFIDKIPVISESEFLCQKNQNEIIVANQNYWPRIVAGLMDAKVQIDRISVFLDGMIIPLMHDDSYMPKWIDFDKLKTMIAKEMLIK